MSCGVLAFKVHVFHVELNHADFEFWIEVHNVGHHNVIQWSIFKE